MEETIRDIALSLRLLARQWRLTVTALITLAVGIGGTTAVFTVVDAVLLRPLPFEDSDRLVMVWLDNRISGIREDQTSYPSFAAWREQSRSFSGMSCYMSWNPVLLGLGPSEYLNGAAVGEDFFQILGARMALGRAFVPEEHQPGGGDVVVLSHEVWKNRFGGDPRIVDKTVQLDDQPMRVVGVLEGGARFPGDVHIWTPLTIGPGLLNARKALFLKVASRLSPGVSLEQAQAEMDSIARRLEAAFPESNKGHGVYLVPLQQQLTKDIRPILLVLMGAAAFVLLIACANVASLLLVWFKGQERDSAIRLSLGASRGRLIRQRLTDGLVLSLLGGVVSLPVSRLELAFFKSFGPLALTRLQDIRLDFRMLFFTLLISLVAAALFALAPAMSTTAFQPSQTLKEGGSVKGGLRHRRFLSSLVAGQLAVTLMLLIGASLLIASFLHLINVDMGFRSRDILTVELRLERERFPESAQISDFVQRLVEQLAALPVVESAGVASAIPLQGSRGSTLLTLEGRSASAGEGPEIPYIIADPGYFRTLGIPLRRGRPFNAADGPDGSVALINEAMARRYWPGEEPLGKRLQLGKPSEDSPWITVVGVVGDVRRLSLDAVPSPEVYLPLSQASLRAMTVVLRTDSDPLALVSEVRQRLAALDSRQPIFEIKTMEQRLHDSLSQRRFAMLLLAAISAMALLLALVGLYGVIANSVAQRIQELAVRMALGARPVDTIVLVLRQGLTITVIGIVVGLAGAFALTRVLSSLLFGVEAIDPVMFLASALLLGGAALAANFLPARRATRIDPLTALKAD